VGWIGSIQEYGLVLVKKNPLPVVSHDRKKWGISFCLGGGVDLQQITGGVSSLPWYSRRHRLTVFFVDDLPIAYHTSVEHQHSIRHT